MILQLRKIEDYIQSWQLYYIKYQITLIFFLYLEILVKGLIIQIEKTSTHKI